MIRRRSNDKRVLNSPNSCPECGEYKLPHKVCPKCGMYKGKTIIQKN